MNSEETQPTHEVRKSNEEPKESPLLHIIHGGAGPPPPSGCDNHADAAGDVVSVNPSHTAIDPLNSIICLPCNSTEEAPNRIINWSNLKTVVERDLGNCKF